MRLKLAVEEAQHSVEPGWAGVPAFLLQTLAPPLSCLAHAWLGALEQNQIQSLSQIVCSFSPWYDWLDGCAWLLRLDDAINYNYPFERMWGSYFSWGCVARIKYIRLIKLTSDFILKSDVFAYTIYPRSHKRHISSQEFNKFSGFENGEWGLFTDG